MNDVEHFNRSAFSIPTELINKIIKITEIHCTRYVRMYQKNDKHCLLFWVTDLWWTRVL